MNPNEITLERHPDADSKGGLNINEKDAGTTTLFVEIVKQFSKKMLQGNFVDMLKISRPAKITSPATHLKCLTNDFRYTQLINIAAEQTDPIERMKYVTTFILAGLNATPIYCRSKAPLNPILGETLQAYKPEDGTSIYLEQTSHHPPNFNYLMRGPNNSYEMYGYGEVNANLTGVNSVKGWREGKNILRMKDGTLITFTMPETRINGLVMGDRIYNYCGTLVIKDFTNKIESVTSFAYHEDGKLQTITKSITGLLFKRDDVLYDQFIIQISQVNKETRQKELICQGEGSWLAQVYIEGKKYWSITDEFTPWTQEGLKLLPSDSSKREDLICIASNEIEEAQKQKDKLENIQRNDKKLREEFEKLN